MSENETGAASLQRRGGDMLPLRFQLILVVSAGSVLWSRGEKHKIRSAPPLLTCKLLAWIIYTRTFACILSMILSMVSSWVKRTRLKCAS